MTPRDGLGRFVPTDLAALWAGTCVQCGEPRDRHEADGCLPDRPFCPDMDGLRFDPSSTADCIDPTRHATGCDCHWGVC